MNLIIRFSYLKNKIGNDQSLNITARIDPGSTYKNATRWQ